MKKSAILTSLFVLLFSTTAFAKDVLDCSNFKELSSLLKKNPIQLSKTNIQKNELHLYGIAGYVISVPGVDTERCEIPSKYIHLMPSLSDVRCDEQTNELVQSAREFSKDYNSIIIPKLMQRKIVICR